MRFRLILSSRCRPTFGARLFATWTSSSSAPSAAGLIFGPQVHSSIISRFQKPPPTRNPSAATIAGRKSWRGRFRRDWIRGTRPHELTCAGGSGVSDEASRVLSARNEGRERSAWDQDGPTPSKPPSASGRRGIILIPQRSAFTQRSSQAGTKMVPLLQTAQRSRAIHAKLPGSRSSPSSGHIPTLLTLAFVLLFSSAPQKTQR